MSRYVYHSPNEPSPRATASGDQNVITLGAVPVACPAWGCGGPPTWYRPYDNVVGMRPMPPTFAPWFGATSAVQQPPPNSGGTLMVADPGILPVSPQPAPTVAAATPLSLAQPGTTLDSSGASPTTATPFSLSTWLTENTLISALPNWGVAATGAALVAFMFLGKGGRR